MDEGSLSNLTFITFLIALHALIKLSFTALASIERRERDSEGNRRAIQFNPNQLRITSQISLMLVRVLIFTLVTVSIKHPLLQLPPELSELYIPALSYGTVLVPLALLVYVLGDLMPGAVGKAQADKIVPMAALPVRALVALLNPLVALMMVIDRALSRVSTDSEAMQKANSDEILSLVADVDPTGPIESEEKEMIRSVLEFADTLVREVMIPRLDVMALDIDASLDEAVQAIVSSGHSRIPVYEEKIDNIKGVLYAKDLLTLIHNGQVEDKPIRALIRPAYFVPETKRADTLFKEMQNSKVHLAIIVDEYGGTAGLVTIEDLLEEIVGEIQDEYDLHEEAPFVELGEDAYLIDASMNLGDFNNLLDVELSDEDNDTLGGYIYGELGRVPEVGETVELADNCLSLRIEQVEGRRIRKVHVTRLRKPDPADEADDKQLELAINRENGAKPA